MKKLIAMALFFVSAMTMSAQSVTIIEMYGVSADYAVQLLTEDETLGVLLESLTDGQGNVVLSDEIKAVIDGINEKAKKGQITDKAVAEDELMDALLVMEQMEGDIDLNGDFNIRDVRALKKMLDDEGECIDLGYGGTIRDVRALNNKLNGQ